MSTQSQPELVFTSSQLAKATSAKLLQASGDEPFFGVSTDSRELTQGDLFIALSGENFDGAQFCRSAVEAGAAGVLVSKKAYQAGLPDQFAAIPIVLVDDTLRALGDLAAWHRRRFPARLVAITGSNGKTTTKEMTAHVLGQDSDVGKPPADVLFNHGNFNNLIGMPRSLLGLRKQHKYAVMEMGMNAPGEIYRLAQIAGPQVGVLTNVHPVHLEGLGSLQAIAQAKGELLEHLGASDVVVLNADDPLVLQQAERTQAKRILFGTSPKADVCIEQLTSGVDGLSFQLVCQGEPVQIHLDRLGTHNAHNAAAAAGVLIAEGLSISDLASRLAAAPSAPMRMEILKLGQARLLIDCYNANPRSMQAALSTLCSLEGKTRWAVLGDMGELGQSSEQLHQQVGRQVAQAQIDGLLAFGKRAAEIAQAAKQKGLTEVEHTESIEKAIAWTREKLVADSWILLKASRSMRLERIVSQLAQAHGVEWHSGH